MFSAYSEETFHDKDFLDPEEVVHGAFWPTLPKRRLCEEASKMTQSLITEHSKRILDDVILEGVMQDQLREALGMEAVNTWLPKKLSF
jgi:hypothetical protein